jgi:hypothetical protein
MRIPWYAAALVAVLTPVFTPTPAGATAPLRMQVTPSVTRAPALVTVRVSVDSSPENRSLRIAASSSDFYRSSEVQLDGSNAAPLSVFEFRNLPPGLYEVTGVLVGAHGPRGSVFALAKVEPSPGLR